MRAMLRVALDDPELLHLTELPDPEPAPEEALVEVTAAALNFADLLMLKGQYQRKPALPFSPGIEIAARVLKLGQGVNSLRPGQRVLGLIGANGCREMVAAPASAFVPIPDDVSDHEAAGLAVTYGTALHAFADRAQLRTGETVAVLGAGGGAGLAAVEVAAQMGARVIACASSEDKLALAREHGAAETVDSSAGDIKDKLKSLGGGEGIDVVYDTVGGELTDPAMRALRFSGRLLVVGFASGTVPSPPLNVLLVKGVSLIGVHYSAFVQREPAQAREEIARLLDWCAEGRLKPHIHRVYPLAETADALRALESRQTRGKILVAPQE